ncbi:MAG: GNAT family N-acyltransferase [Synechococcaceae cyanobacterium ELA182]
MEDFAFNHIHTQLPQQRCFDHNQFSAYFLAAAQFHPIASWVGALRASSYRQISPLGPEQLDLDGRDSHYWHLLILDREKHCLAGSLRMGLSRWHGSAWDGSHSYLEHCYPGLDQFCRERGMSYAEIGRTLVATPYQRNSQVLLMLLRAMASIPLATGHTNLMGMVSFNHLQHGERLISSFLAALLKYPFAEDCDIPPARHPFPSRAEESSEAGLAPVADSLTQLERRLEKEFQEPFRAPLLLKKYMSFGNAKVISLSLARDFNQICEILMHCDLKGLQPRQQKEFVINNLIPVWENTMQC